MSLDVYLTLPGTPAHETKDRIFIREDGATKEITRKEWDSRYPNRAPVTATVEQSEVYSANITHNLARMAQEAGIYNHLWRPDEIGATKAAQLIQPLREGLELLESDPQRFKQYNAANGWGLYKHFVPFVENYLAACEATPEADVSVWR